MTTTIRSAAYKHGYLIITAAWLYTLSFIVSNYRDYISSPQQVQNKLEQQLNQKEERVAFILADTGLLSSLLKDIENNPAKNKLAKESFGLFIYENTSSETPSLLFWNSNQYYTDPEDIQRKDGNYFLKHQNGSFELIKKTIHLKGQSFFVVALLPVKWDYFIENKYLISDFEGFPALDDQYAISSDSTAFHVHSIDGKDLFKIKLKDEKYIADYDIFTILLRTFAILFLFFYLHVIATDVSSEKKIKKSPVFS